MKVNNSRNIDKYLVKVSDKNNLKKFVEVTLTDLNKKLEQMTDMERPSLWTENSLTLLIGATNVKYKFYTFEELSEYSFHAGDNFVLSEVAIYLVPTVNVTEIPYQHNSDIRLIDVGELSKLGVIDGSGIYPRKVSEWFATYLSKFIVGDGLEDIHSYSHLEYKIKAQFEDFGEEEKPMQDIHKTEMVDFSRVDAFLCNEEKRELRRVVSSLMEKMPYHGTQIMVGATVIKPKFRSFEDMYAYLVKKKIILDAVHELRIYVTHIGNTTEIKHPDRETFEMYTATEIGEMTLSEYGISPRLSAWFKVTTNRVLEESGSNVRVVEGDKDEVIGYTGVCDWLPEEVIVKLDNLVDEAIHSKEYRGSKNNLRILIGTVTSIYKCDSFIDFSKYIKDENITIENDDDFRVYATLDVHPEIIAYGQKDTYKRYRAFEIADVKVTDFQLTAPLIKMINSIPRSQPMNLSSIEDIDDSPLIYNGYEEGTKEYALLEKINEDAKTVIPLLDKIKAKEEEAVKHSISRNINSVDKHSMTETATKQFFKTENGEIAIHGGTTFGVSHYLILSGGKVGQIQSGIDVYPVDEVGVFDALKELTKGFTLPK